MGKEIGWYVVAVNLIPDTKMTVSRLLDAGNSARTMLCVGIPVEEENHSLDF